MTMKGSYVRNSVILYKLLHVLRVLIKNLANNPPFLKKNAF